MKKTGANQTGSSRTGVRSSSTGKVTKAAKPSRSTKSSAKSVSTSKKSPKKGKKFVPAIVLASVLAVGAVAGGVMWKMGFFETRYDITMADGTVVRMTAEELKASLISDTFIEGIIIDDINVSGMTKDAALAAVIANQPEAPIDIDVNLELDETEYPLDLSSLPITNNASEVVDEAYSYLSAEGIEDVFTLIDIHNQREALKVTPKTYTSAYTLNTDDIASLVHDALDEFQCDAVEAEITGFDVETLEFEYTPSSRGYDVDIDTAIDDVKALLDSGIYEGTIVVNAEVTEPTLTTEIIEEEFGLISSSESTTTSSSNRNHNISITAEKINGHIVQPGEEWSFNDFIGPRNASTGYMTAGTIQNGTTQDDYGGGICQVSTMIYQSVIKADLEIVERHEHMWPSSYVQVGTDAAVDWGSQDFVFRNNSDYPIVMVAYWNPDNSKITVQLYGHMFADGVYLDIEGATASISPAGTEYIQNPSLPVGTTNQIRGAHDGVTANSWQVWYDADGNEINRVELPVSHYSTVSRQIEVGTLQPDGSQASFDPATGAVTTTVTETTPAETEATTAAPAPTDAPPATEATTAAPPETTPAPPPPETTAAPTEPAPTEAT